MKNEKDFLSIKEIADKFKISTRAVRKWIKAKQIKAKKITNKWLIHKDDLAEFEKNKIKEVIPEPKMKKEEKPKLIEEQPKIEKSISEEVVKKTIEEMKPKEVEIKVKKKKERRKEKKSKEKKDEGYRFFLFEEENGKEYRISLFDENEEKENE